MIKDYPKNLEIFAQQAYIGSYLNSGASEIITSKAQSLREMLQRRKKGKPVEWEFSISNPLTFKFNDVSKLQVDVSCEIKGEGEDIKKQNIIIRVWSFDDKICYRQSIDATELKNKIEKEGGRRVMIRFHIDQKASKAPEPLYHIHMGGIPEDSENYWFPKQIKVPRLPYYPLDLILLCEFILVNFFYEDSETLRKKPEWIALVKKSEKLFLRPYLTESIDHIDNSEETLLGSLIKQ